MKIDHPDVWLKGALFASVLSLVTTAVCCAILARVGHAESPGLVLLWGFRLQSFCAVPLTLFAFIGTALGRRGSDRLFTWSLVAALVSVLAVSAPGIALFYAFPGPL